jgi:hypothetical protein
MYHAYPYQNDMMYYNNGSLAFDVNENGNGDGE